MTQLTRSRLVCQYINMTKRRTTIPKRRINQKQLLNYLAEVRPLFLPIGISEHVRALKRGLPELDKYFPYSLEKTANQLERQGYVEKINTKDGIEIKINHKGKTQILKYNLLDMNPKRDKWDGKWRLVFFDVSELRRTTRDSLRRYLHQIGMELFQKSVYISPYDITDQVKYLREILDIPNSIKIARLDWVENEDELKEIFELK